MEIKNKVKFIEGVQNLKNEDLGYRARQLGFESIKEIILRRMNQPEDVLNQFNEMYLKFLLNDAGTKSNKLAKKLCLKYTKKK